VLSDDVTDDVTADVTDDVIAVIINSARCAFAVLSAPLFDREATALSLLPDAIIAEHTQPVV